MKKLILFERIKRIVNHWIEHPAAPSELNFSSYLSAQLNYHYTYLANVFAEVYGSTLQSYILTQKIEKVKELLITEGMTVTDISVRMGYCTTAHLCVQFKKVTGITPKQFVEQAVVKFKSQNL